jgi:hypothetical protein
MRPDVSRGWPPQGGAPAEAPRKGARVAGEREATVAPSVADRDLPRWESFPTQDRRLLVGLLIRTARRQARHGSTSRASAERG